MNDFAALTPQPLPDPDTRDFWESLKNGTFGICRCQQCGLYMHPPLERCRACNGAVGIEPVSGDGTVVSWILVRQPTVPGRMPPYLVATVELAEQPGLHFVGILHADPDHVQVGAKVRASVVPLPGGDFKTAEFALIDG